VKASNLAYFALAVTATDITELLFQLQVQPHLLLLIVPRSSGSSVSQMESSPLFSSPLLLALFFTGKGPVMDSQASALR
jgi:hypothetical protein